MSQDQVSVEVSGGDVVISGEITRRERAGVLRRATRRQRRVHVAGAGYEATQPGGRRAAGASSSAKQSETRRDGSRAS